MTVVCTACGVVKEPGEKCCGQESLAAPPPPRPRRPARSFTAGSFMRDGTCRACFRKHQLGDDCDLGTDGPPEGWRPPRRPKGIVPESV